MKKIMLFIVTFMLAGLYVNAQENDVQIDKKIFIDLSAGPSFPVGAFASKNTTDTVNSVAGFAKTGYNINLRFGYQLDDNFGIASVLLYSRHKLDISGFEYTSVSTDHWQYYGFLIGPMVTAPLGENAKVDFKLLGGISNANSPAVDVDGEIFLKEDWNSSFAVQLGTDLRYNISENMYLITNLDYSYMKPRFNVAIPGDSRFSHVLEQKTGTVNFNAGIGVNF